MEDFVRKTRGVRDINSLPLDTNHELDIVSDVKGKIYIKILNRYKELLFDNGTEQWVIDMLNNLEVDVEQLKEDILDIEQSLSGLPMIEDKLNAVETKLTQINALFTQMQTDVNGLDLRTAELEREVVQLALKDQELLDKINNLDLNVDLDMLFSNSTDFGDYDYSGNPNLMPYITDPWVGAMLPNGDTVKDSVKRIITHTKTATANAGDILSIGLGIPRAVEANNQYLITALKPSTPYTLTVTMSVGSDWTGGTNTIGARVRYLNATGGTETPINVLLPENLERDKMITHTFTGTTKADLTGMKNCYVQIFSVNGEDKGTVSVSYDVKLEIGSTATPYQPNLLDEPYYLSKAPLGENIADPTVSFPIKTSAYRLYGVNMLEEFKVGQIYTLTMKATKPASQIFWAYNGGNISLERMSPVEGLTDVWSCSFTVSTIDTGSPKLLSIYQSPQSTVGACQIDWLKIEKGDTRTPNIPYHKYVGINLKESENPKDYEWIHLASAAETVNDRLSKTITTYDTVNALQNNRLTSLESKVVDTTWQNVTVTKPFTSVTQPQVKKQNGIVYMRGTISNGAGDCFTLPEGFRPPAGAYEMQFRLPCRSASAEDYATIYVRPSGLCSIAGVHGTKPIFLSGIIFSTT